MLDIPVATPLSPVLGVVVENYDLRRDLDAAAWDALRGLLWKHYLLLFRNQNISADEHRDVLKSFGSVADERGDSTYYTFVINRLSPDSDEGDELLYHCDYSFTPKPLPIVSLYGLDIPAVAALTRFANGVRACMGLPPALEARLEGQFVLHASDVTREAMMSAGPLRPEDLASKDYRGTLHPALLTHPTTGERILFINEYLSVRFEGMSPEESEALLSEVFARLYASENVYEHHWRQGDLIIFDNIALQHSRVKGAPRTLRRLIVTEVP